MAQISDLIDNAEFTSQFIKSKFLSYEADFVRKEIKLLQKTILSILRMKHSKVSSLHTLLTIRRIKMKQPVTISARQLDAVKRRKNMNGHWLV